jgi:hypothetical protein
MSGLTVYDSTHLPVPSELLEYIFTFIEPPGFTMNEVDKELSYPCKRNATTCTTGFEETDDDASDEGYEMGVDDAQADHVDDMNVMQIHGSDTFGYDDIAIDDDTPVSDKLPTRAVLYNGPWTLGQVCTRWRHTVRQLHQLWSTIDVVYRDVEFGDKGGFINLIEEGLNRSGSWPLHIRLAFPEVFMDEELAEDLDDSVLDKAVGERLTRRSIDLIFDHAFRFRTFAVDMHETFSMITLLSHRPLAFTSLHVLSLRLPNSGMTVSDDSYVILDIFKSSRDLKYIELRGFDAHWNIKQAVKEWQHLRELSHDAPLCFEDTHSLIQQAPLLTRYAAEVEPPQKIIRVGSSVVTLMHSNMTYLDIPSIGLLEYLSLPALQMLKIRQSAEDPIGIDIFMDFVERSECKLKRLWIRANIPSNRHSRLFSYLLDGVEDMKLRVDIPPPAAGAETPGQVVTSLMRHLTPSQGRRLALPKLQKLELLLAAPPNEQLWTPYTPEFTGTIIHLLYSRSGFLAIGGLQKLEWFRIGHWNFFPYETDLGIGSIAASITPKYLNQRVVPLIAGYAEWLVGLVDGGTDVLIWSGMSFLYSLSRYCSLLCFCFYFSFIFVSC